MQKKTTVIRAVLLQVPAVDVDGNRISFHLKKAEAVFYYLMVEKKASRQELAALLWPNEDMVQASRHLRDSLYFIKKYLHPEAVMPVGRSALTLNPELEFCCDLDEFLQEEEKDYEGEFLQGFTPGGSAEYEEWMERMREKLQSIYQERLRDRARKALSGKQWEEAVKQLQAMIRMDPLAEEGYVSLMKIYREMHAYSKAAFTYQKLRTVLAEELGIAPLEETSKLYRELMGEWNENTMEGKNYGSDFLVARYEIFRRMCADFEREDMGRRKAVLLQGEAGVGKTHLLNYFLKHAKLEGRLVLTSSCYQSKTEEVLHPWQTVMLALSSHIAGGTLPLPKESLQTLPGNFALLSGGGPQSADLADVPVIYNPNSICDSILAVLSMAVQKRKMILVFEDIHWMDSASLRLLDQVLHTIESGRLSVLLICREPAGEAVHGFLSSSVSDGLIKKYELVPFNREETMQFIEQFGAGELPATLKEQVYASARGNAFLLVQLLNNLMEQQNPQLLPGDMKEVFSYRIAGLSQEGQQVLNMIAMFPEAAPCEILEKLSNKAPLELLYLCLELRQRSIVNEISDGGTVSLVFIQPEFRERVYLGIRPLNRRILHLNIASILEGISTYPGVSAQLVYHYSRGGDRLNAFKYKVQGLQGQINLCYELFPSREEDGLELDTESRALALFHDMEEELGQLKREFPAEERILAMQDELLYAKCRYCVYKGFYEEALDAAGTVLRHEDCTPEIRMGIHRQMIYYGIQIYDADKIEYHIAEGLRLFDENTGLKEKVVFERMRGVMLMMRKNYELCRKELKQAFAMLENAFGRGVEYAVHASYVLNYMGESYREEGRYEEAVEYYEEAIQVARRFGAVPGLPIFTTNYACSVFAAGKYEEAERLFEEAGMTAPYTRKPAGRAVALAYRALYSQSDKTRCSELLRQARHYAEGWKSPVEQGTVFLLQAWIGFHWERECGGVTAGDYFGQTASESLELARNLLTGRAGIFEEELLRQCPEGILPDASPFRRNV